MTDRKPLAEFIAEGRALGRYPDDVWKSRAREVLPEALDRLESLATENDQRVAELEDAEAAIAELQAAVAQARADAIDVAVDVRVDQPHFNKDYESGFRDACETIERALRARSQGRP